jgi:hypothetical protein
MSCNIPCDNSECENRDAECPPECKAKVQEYLTYLNMYYFRHGKKA